MTPSSAELSKGIGSFRVLPCLPVARSYARGVGTTAVVWLVWVATAAWAVWYIVNYGLNLPYWDEWATIPYLQGQRPITLDWLWSWHNEHRIPLPRILYLVSAVLAGKDVRGPMLANALILCLIAAVGIQAARRLHGRTRLTDAVIPLSVAGVVNTATLVQGFQLVFVLTTALFCTLVTVLAVSRRTPSLPELAVVGLCLVGLPMTGGAGVILALPLALFIGARALREHFPSFGLATGLKAWSKERRRRSSGVAACVISGLALIEIVLYDPLHAPRNFRAGPADTLRGAVQFLATAISPDSLSGYWWVLSAIIGGGALVATFVVARQVLVSSSDRNRGAGLLACWAAVGALVLGIGYGRGYGLESRYATLAVAIVFLAYLCVNWVGGAPGSALRWIFLIAVVALMPLNFSSAMEYGKSRRDVYVGLRSDIAAGIPVELLADKYYDDIYPDTRETASFLESLQAFSMGPFSNHDLQLNEARPAVIAEELVSVDPILVQDMTRVGDSWQGSSTQPRLTFSFGLRNLAGVRLQYIQTNPADQPARLQVWWAQNASGFGQKGKDARVWIDPVGVQHDLTVWIGEKAGALMIQPDAKPTKFKLNRIVLLLAETTPQEAAVRAAAVAMTLQQLHDGAFVRSSGFPGIYLMEQGRKRGFPSWQTYLADGGSPDMGNVVLLTDDELTAIPDGALLPANPVEQPPEANE